MKPDVVVDVGNSCVKWGHCSAERVTEVARLPHGDEDAWQRQATAWGLGDGAAWALSGVAPAQRDRLAAWLRGRGSIPLVLDSHQQLPLRVNVDHPEQVGLDRLFNAVAVNTVRTADRAAVIVDLGTAITVDLVDAAGVFQGGVIAPGWRLMATALHEHTALRRRFDLDGQAAVPAKNTAAAVRAGIDTMVANGVQAAIRKLTDHSGAPVDLFCTGGDAIRFAGCWPGARLWPEMTLEGVRLSAAV